MNAGNWEWILFSSYLPSLRLIGTLLSPPQSFKHSLYQSAVRRVPQGQSPMDRSGAEPLPDVCRFLVRPCRFFVHRWISRLWLNLTAWNSPNPKKTKQSVLLWRPPPPPRPVGVVVHVVLFSWNNNNVGVDSKFHCSLQELFLHGKYEFK